MSSDNHAISVRQLGKSYKIQHQSSHATAAEALLHRLRNPFNHTPQEEIWALEDVSFDVAHGDIVGVIGRNGAGKSTLLKILSRITEPTTGEARIAGRVGSLIEVGTGFQPELTGRENIYLNGAILGMRKREITRRFDEIVDFSGVEKFLDTPVKRYSSGMYVRLAFAVAAHLDTEILLVDEVLSVGDAEFQKKSLGKMGDVATSGRTIFLVSHNIATLETLCKTGLLFNRGRLETVGNIGEVIADYYKLVQPGYVPGNGASGPGPVNYGRSYAYFRSADLVDEQGKSTRVFPLGATLHVRARIEADRPIDYPTFFVHVDNMLGKNVLTAKSPRTEAAIPKLLGPCELSCSIGPLPIMPGDYTINIALWKNSACLEDIDTQIQFTIRDADAFGDGWGAHATATCIARSEWTLDEAAEADSLDLRVGL